MQGWRPYGDATGRYHFWARFSRDKTVDVNRSPLAQPNDLRQHFVRPQSRRMIVNRRGDDQLVGAGLRNETLQPLRPRRGRADERTGEHSRGLRLLRGSPVGLDVVDRRAEL